LNAAALTDEIEPDQTPLAASADEDAQAAADDATYTATLQQADDNNAATATTTTFGAALLRANVSSSAGYYERVETLDQLNALCADSSSQFAIVAVDGNVMVGSNTQTISSDTYYDSYSYAADAVLNSMQASMLPVRSSDGSIYFVLNDGSSYVSPTNRSKMHWQFTSYTYSQRANNYSYASDDFYRVKNKSTGGYLWLGNSYGYYSSYYSYYDYGTGIQLTRQSSEKTWRLHANASSYSYWLNSTYSSSTGFSLEQTEITESSFASSYVAASNHDFIILHYVSGVSAVDDEAQADAIESESVTDINSETKPQTVADTQTHSSAVSNTTNVTDDSALLGAQVTAVSDATSSNIENILQNATTQSDNDGRVVSDKSVVYQKDDYGAFDANSYSMGDYSVTLSALGQEWTTQEEGNTETPIDVVFVLDLSSSMYSGPSYEDPRWQDSVDAINAITVDIMNRNENNRVGLVVYSDNAKTVLELNHYDLSKSNNKILDYDKDELTWATYVYNDGETSKSTTTQVSNESLFAGMGYTIEKRAYYYGQASFKTAPNLTAQVYNKSTDKVEYVTVDNDGASLGNQNLGMFTTDGFNSDADGLWGRTFTQLGLQQTYKVFSNGASSRNIQVKTNDATGNVVTKTVTRQPVEILLSDGEPTLGTYDYMNPSSGPLYGIGYSSGVFGYGTVLSANYFKNMTSVAYDKKAAFYSFGLGLSEDSQTFGCAILDPSTERIDAYSDKSIYKEYLYYSNYPSYSTSYYNSTTEYYSYRDSYYLYLLLKSDYSGLKTQDTLFGSSPVSLLEGFGYTHAYLTSAKNPYSNYSYCDDSFFGEKTSTELLANLKSILDDIQYYNNYGFLLEEGTSLDMLDEIGSGMEVKGTPVLRYNGQNYASTKNARGSDSSGAYTQYWYEHTATLDTNTAKKEADQTRNLGLIVVKVYDAVYTDAGVLQTPQKVLLSVPEQLVPVVYPNLFKQFYFEELPVRLIFKVGLTQASRDSIANAQGDYEATFYTNTDKTSGGTNTYKAAATTVTFEPKVGSTDNTDNTYYKDLTSGSTYNFAAKTTAANASGTYAYSFAEIPTITQDSTGKDTSIKVTQYLGNIGKLSISKPDGLALVVSKEWSDANAASQSAVTVSVYGTGTRTSTYGGSVSGTWKVGDITLSAANNWKATFTAAKEQTSGSYTYNYTNFYVAENLSSASGFVPTYKQGSGDDIETLTQLEAPLELYGGGEVSGAVAVTGGKLTVVNAKAYTLPSSGGVGAGAPVAAGCALAALSLAALATLRRTRRTVTPIPPR
jgi:hypothetical protein